MVYDFDFGGYPLRFPSENVLTESKNFLKSNTCLKIKQKIVYNILTFKLYIIHYNFISYLLALRRVGARSMGHENRGLLPTLDRVLNTITTTESQCCVFSARSLVYVVPTQSSPCCLARHSMWCSRKESTKEQISGRF